MPARKRTLSALTGSNPDDFALAFVDIDGFKHVNDYYGHDTGDRLLARIAERLGTALRRSDMLARLSGDEFVLLISPMGKFEDLKRDLGWISERLKEPFFVDGHEIFSSASIGVSLYPRDGRSYETLRRNADLAMYVGKTRTKGTVRYYDSSIRHVADDRSRMEQRLRLAIRDKRVCCAYQPKVDLRSGETAGVEVLMRWRDEDGVIQAPGDFVGLAVELGLIDDLTHFILAETVGSVDEINTTFGPHATISINVAARQATDTRFMRSFIEALEATGFAGRFTIEITEEAFLAHSEFQKLILPMVREVGAKVSIDDFGVGYSNMHNLATLDVEGVKIDRSFAMAPDNSIMARILAHAIEMAHESGRAIVVEGVETRERLDMLRANPLVDFAQGFYVSRPLAIDAFIQFLEAWTPFGGPDAAPEAAIAAPARKRKKTST
jgi:diguanylate cyclase (GGDEF)-like protein